MFQTVEFLFNIHSTDLCWVILYFWNDCEGNETPVFNSLFYDIARWSQENRIRDANHVILYSGSKNGKNISVLTIFEITSCTYNFNSSELKFKKKDFLTFYKFPQNCTFSDHCEILLVYKNNEPPVYGKYSLLFQST